MEATVNFLLKSGLGLLSLYLFYRAVLRNETNFRFNRLYLLLAPLVALSLPLITWPAIYGPAPMVAQALQLPEVMVLSYQQPGTGSFLTLHNLAWGFYLLVALVLALKFVRQLWHIRRLKSRATAVEHMPDAVQVIYLRQPYASFAFLHQVFLGNQEQLSERERQQVLAHELAHVQLGHSYDVLYYELLSIVLWFNPVVWLLKQELRNLHEFQADARVVGQHQLQAYRALLSKEVLFQMGLPVGSYFQKPQVLRRLYMLQQRGKQAGWMRPLLTLPLLFVLLVSLTSHQATADLASPFAAASQEKQITTSFSEKGKPGEDRPEQSASVSSTDATNATPAPAQAGKMPVMKGDNAATMPVRKGSVPEEMPDSYSKDIYTYVEEMPQFKGGEAEMLKYLGMHVRYPKAAQEAKVEGLVVASFVVETDGTLRDIKIIKPLGQGTDEEVIRVIGTMNGNWLPGKQDGKAVPVQYTLPMRFALKN